MTTQRTPYSGFTGQYIAGKWRPGMAGKTILSVNPYNGETLAEIALAGTADLDEAYAAAAAAQIEWARTGPSQKIDLFRRVISILDDRQEKSSTGSSARPVAPC